MKTHYTMRLMVSGIILLAMLAGLPAAPSSTRAADRPRVVASFSILADVVGRVGGDAIDLETLISLGSNPHAFEPSARDVATLSDADLVFVVGIGFEEGVDHVLDEAAGENLVTVSTCVRVRPVVEGDEHDHQHEDHAEEHSGAGVDCEAHHQTLAAVFGDSDGQSDAGTLGMVSDGVCDEAACDPHVWTDPANVALWALTIRDTLTAYDPDNATIYAENTEIILNELAVLDEDIRAVFAPIPVEQRFIVTNHLSFNYFAVRYGLTTVGVVLPGGSTGSEPSAQSVIALINAIKDTGTRAIFTETTVSDDLAQQIADETGATITPLYTGSLSEADGPAATYLDYMRYNASQIAAALR